MTLDRRLSVDLKTVLLAVNKLLSQYTALHDHAFAFSWRRVIPIPGVFEAIDYKKIADELHVIHDALTVAQAAVQDLKQKPRCDADARPLEVLGVYVDELHETVGHFQEVCMQLWYKSQKPSSYSWDTYRRAMERYESKVKAYISTGERLNSVVRTGP